MQKFIIGNWKQNPENIEVATELLKITEKFGGELVAKNIFVTHAVPSIFVGYLINISKEIILQNISCFEGGSHTGEISAQQAKNLGINTSLVGHSETRLGPTNPRGDEDMQVNLKIKNLIAQNMWTVLCVGEYERDENFKNTIKTQTENCLKDIPSEKLVNVCIAYEPIWAIGKSALKPATDEEIVDTIKYIKEFLKEKYQEVGEKIPVLYGGSVDENNAKAILNLESVDGLLIGRASSDKEKWAALLQNLIKN